MDSLSPLTKEVKETPESNESTPIPAVTGEAGQTEINSSEFQVPGIKPGKVIFQDLSETVLRVTDPIEIEHWDSATRNAYPIRSLVGKTIQGHLPWNGRDKDDTGNPRKNAISIFLDDQTKLLIGGVLPLDLIWHGEYGWDHETLYPKARVLLCPALKEALGRIPGPGLPPNTRPLKILQAFDCTRAYYDADGMQNGYAHRILALYLEGMSEMGFVACRFWPPKSDEIVYVDTVLRTY